jgi:hypothetical protein
LEIAVDVLGLGKGDTGTTAQRRIGKILHRLGWTSIRDSRGRGYVRGAT